MIYIIPTDTCFWIACPIYDVKSYDRIYEIKKRDYKKPLAIMIESFSWLEKHTTLNKNQIDFLKKYSRPWTVMTNCPKIEMILNLEQDDFKYKNKNEYKKIAFRVANNKIQKELLKEIWPIFLTSANFSSEKEIYDINEAKKQFSQYKDEIIFLWEDIVLDSKIPPSDIFEFEGDSLEIKFLRKN